MPDKIADKVSITICGDGGCGKNLFILENSKLDRQRAAADVRWTLFCLYEIWKSCWHAPCAGKSSITLRLVRSQWISELVVFHRPCARVPDNWPPRCRYDPTIEDSYSVTRTVDGLSYHLSLTDTAGQEEYRGLWASSNLQSDAFLLVYDITNANSLNGLDWFLDMIDIESESRIEQNNRLLKEKGTRVRGRVEEGWKAPPVVIIAGNKCDLNDARSVQSKTGWDYARSRRCGFMETSAREMVNIEETFACTWMISERHKKKKY